MKSIERNRALVMALGAVLTAACAAAPEPPRPVRPVRVATVETVTPSSDLRYSAVLQAREQVALAFKVGGYVGEILSVRGEAGSRLVQQGDTVRKGTTLARLDTADYVERVNQAKAQRSETAASLERARADAGRADRLYAAKSLTRPEYDAASAALAIAEARLAGAAAQLEAAELVLRDSSLSSPLDAVVLSRSIEPGTLANAGTVAFQLADVSQVKAVFGAPDRIVAGLAPGQRLAVIVDRVEHVGRISAISPSAEGANRVFTVEVTIDNKAGDLKPGMVATAIVADTAPRASAVSGPVVPLASIVKSSDGAYAVFVVDGSGDRRIAHQRHIALGPIAGDRIAVTEGIASGDWVVVSGATLLIDGEPVRIIP